MAINRQVSLSIIYCGRLHVSIDSFSNLLMPAMALDLPRVKPIMMTMAIGELHTKSPDDSNRC